MSILTEKKACTEGANWADSQTDYKKAWEACDRADWMLWAAQKFNVDLKKLTLAKVACARTVQHLMTDNRSILALEVAEKFGEGVATLEEMNAAAADAAAAADDAADAYAAAAAAAAYAAAADAAADAAAADADADADARISALKEMASLVRENISFDDLKI